MSAVRRFYNYPFSVLLGALLIMIAGAPSMELLARHVPGMAAGLLVMLPLNILLTLAAMVALWRTARHRAVGMFLAALVLILLTLGGWITHHAFAATQFFAQILFLAYVLGVIATEIFRAPVVNGNVLCGSICLYLLFGVLWGFLLCLIETLDPGSFAIQNIQGVTSREFTPINQPGWLLYLSFASLTTVAYGDILPVKSLARSAVVIEAVAGQVMLVVIIARLVGLHVAQRSGSSSKKVS